MARDEVVIRLVLPRWSRRRWIAAGCALLALGATAAYGIDVTWIGPGKPLSSQSLKANFTEIETRLAALESGARDCLPGYAAMIAGGVTTCTKGNDVMVKVGTGPAAFWIDRYEASVWSDAAGTMGKAAGVPWGASIDDFPLSFPDNGQRAPANVNFVDLFAVSKPGVPPSGSLTWFQAQQACAAGGKRLPNDEEWLRAASGTSDPGAVDGLVMGETRCNTQSAGKRATGAGGNCASAWGAQDMVGNVAEWIGQWYAGLGWAGGIGQQANGANENWGLRDYNGDVLRNIASSAYDDTWREGHPSTPTRGGTWDEGTDAGIFSLNLNSAPSGWHKTIGFRCVARGF